MNLSGGQGEWTVAFECDDCGWYYRQQAAPSQELTCPQCGISPATIPPAWALEQGCPVCGCRHLYRRKDFNQLLGLALVGLGAVLGVLISYWFLLAFSLLDWVIYRRNADLAACYRCAAELRGVDGTALLEVFDHHTAEIYEFKPAGEKT